MLPVLLAGGAEVEILGPLVKPRSSSLFRTTRYALDAVLALELNLDKLLDLVSLFDLVILEVRNILRYLVLGCLIEALIVERRVAASAQKQALPVPDHGLAMSAPDALRTAPKPLTRADLLLMLVFKALDVPALLAARAGERAHSLSLVVALAAGNSSSQVAH